MNLQEFKDALSSDASKRADQQEKTIAELHGMLHSRDEEIAMLKNQRKVLFNRCKVTSRGMLCLFCQMRNDCQGSVDA